MISLGSNQTRIHSKGLDILTMQTKKRSKMKPPDRIKVFYIMSAVCFLFGFACPQNHTFERLFINFRAVLYGLAENYTVIWATEKTSFPQLILPAQPLRMSEFSTALLTWALTLISL